MGVIERLNALAPIWFLIWLVATIAGLWCFSALVKSIRQALPAAKIERRDVLTPNETEFFGRLKRALPDYEVLAQVSMGALLKTTVPESHPQFWSLRKQFAQKIVDFVVVRRDEKHKKASVVVVIELDDRTHDPKKDAKRDAMLLAAGIRTLRYQSRSKPSESQIARDVRSLAGSS